MRHQLNKVRTLRKRTRKNPTPHLHNKLTELETTLQTLIDKSKDEFLQSISLSFQSKPRQLYNYLSSLSKLKSKPNFLIKDGQSIEDPFQRALCFNNFFHSTFTDSSLSLPPMSSLPAPPTCIDHIEFSEEDVYQGLIKLDPTKAKGCDQLHPMILRLCTDPLTHPLHKLFTASLNSGIIPSEWKIHKICPIPKSGNPLHVENYRPISLLCNTGKVLERLVYDKIINFITPKLAIQQHGFLKNRSCLSQLLLSFNFIYDHLDKNIPVDTIYLDFRKAFDSVPHNELLLKLWKLGITGSLWKWFEAYLKDRHHYVTIDNASSPLLPVISGVPQGSILGPLLFLIYINDLPEQVDYTSCYLFADDTKLLKAITDTDDELQLQQDLNTLNRWCIEWKLNLNVDKCSTMRLTLSSRSTQQRSSYSINNRDLETTHSQRDLGVVVQRDLLWTEHYNKISRKAYMALNLIRRILPPHTSTNLKRQLYLSLVRAHLTYCSQLWRPRLIKDIINLERIQRRATKFILNNNQLDYKSRLVSLRLLPLMYWLEMQDILFLVKCLQQPTANPEIANLVSFSSSITRAGQSGNKLKVNLNKTTSSRHFYTSRIVRLWNTFPVETIDLSKSFRTIKSRVREHLINN